MNESRAAEGNNANGTGLDGANQIKRGKGVAREEGGGERSAGTN